MPETTEAARAVVGRLSEEWDWPEPSLIHEIVGLGEAAVAPLIELLTPDVLEDAKIDDRANAIVYYVIQLLGSIRSAAAIPALIHLYSVLDEAEDYDDDLIECLPDTLLAQGPEAIGPLMTVATDESLSWYPRCSAIETATNLAGQDAERRAQIAAALRPVLAERVRHTVPIRTMPLLPLPDSSPFGFSPLQDDDTDIVAELVSGLADVNDVEARPLIDSAYRAGLVNAKIIGLEDVNDIYAEGGQTDFREPWPWLEHYEEDYRKHQEEAKDASEAAQRIREIEHVMEEELGPQPVVIGKRLGRNDACWCGSDKKYKKCHLFEDEKEGRA